MAIERNIAVDIGNTRIKSADFKNNVVQKEETWSSLRELFKAKQHIKTRWIFSTVRGNSREIEQIFGEESYVILTGKTKLPVILEYKTPETLGMDRIAALIGGQSLFPERNLLVIDAGTCITYDLMDSNGVYKGGIISPGMKMRMTAMHHFTRGLPDISEEWREIDLSLLGKSTKECLLKGSFDAAIQEMNGFIEDFNKEFKDLSVLLTGGDADNFESKLKGAIFARSNLVLIGLNRILNYHQDAG